MAKAKKSKPGDVLEILEAWLERNGFDGLYQPGVCACLGNDLAPCGQIQGDCKPGFKRPCNCGEVCEWHIGAEKPGREENEGGEENAST